MQYSEQSAGVRPDSMKVIRLVAKVSSLRGNPRCFPRLSISMPQVLKLLQQAPQLTWKFTFETKQSLQDVLTAYCCTHHLDERHAHLTNRFGHPVAAEEVAQNLDLSKAAAVKHA